MELKLRPLIAAAMCICTPKEKEEEKNNPPAAEAGSTAAKV
jgi:hypothetical protein